MAIHLERLPKYGVNNWQDAYVVTKRALWAVMYGTDVRTAYRSVEQGASARAGQLIDAIERLTNIGRYGTGSFNSSPTVNTTSIAAGIDNLNPNYISKVFTVTSAFNHSSYRVELTGNMPEGTRVTDLQNNSRTVFYAGEQFKVLFSKASMGSNIWNPDGLTWSSQYIGFDVNITAYLQNNPILWGVAPNPGWQDYALVTFGHTRGHGNAPFNYRTEGSIVEVIKESENHNYWTDQETGSRILGVTFEISRADTNEVILVETTDANGIIDVSGLPIGVYNIREIEAPEHWVINENVYTFEITVDGEIIGKTITNVALLGGFVNVDKIAGEYNVWTGEEAGARLYGAVFNILSENKEVLYTVTTNYYGRFVEDILLGEGVFYLQEIEAPFGYSLDPTLRRFTITENGQRVVIEITNYAVEIELEIEKDGIRQAQPLDEIRYTFPTLRNNSPVAVDNFTWIDNLPTDYIRITRLFTGTFNAELEYNVYFKTNKSDEYVLIRENLSTKENNHIDFEEIELLDEEYIISFKVYFGTVPAGFEAVEMPFMFARVNEWVQSDDTWTNITRLTGTFNGVPLEDECDHTVRSYQKALPISRLPRTGF